MFSQSTLFSNPYNVNEVIQTPQNYQSPQNMHNPNKSQTISSYLSYSGSPQARNGMFFGFELGYIEAKGNLSLGGTTILSQKKGGVNYGVMLGYAYFFNNYIGTRVYGNLNASHIKFSNVIGIDDTLLSALNWGMNVDLLINFLALRNFDFGVFLGVFFGANSFLETGLFDYISKTSESAGFNVSRTCFDVALNVGLRVALARSVWLEAAIKVPFFKSYIVNEGAYSRVDLSYIGAYKIFFKSNYSANFRILWQF